MADRTRSGNRQRRSDAREKRRALAAKPFEELDEAAGAEESGGGARSTLRQAATTAVAGALAAGVAGAAKALAARREEPDEPERDADSEAQPQAHVEEEQPEEPERDTDAKAQPQAQVEEEQPEERDRDDQQQDEDDDAQPQAAAEPEQDEEEDEQPEESDGAPRGAPTSEVKEIVEEARRELQELLGAEAESVSGFHRSDGRWTVTIEVVNVRRVPDTTDVLSSYEVAFDDDRNLVSITETRRYRRSQVEEG